MLPGRDLCVGLITRPVESYRLWCVAVCDLETSWMRRPWPTGGCRAKNKQNQTNSSALRRTVLRHCNAECFTVRGSGTGSVPPHSGHQQAASSVQCTTSCKHSLVFLRMGEIIARNTLSWLKLLIKLLLLHLVCCLYYYYYYYYYYLEDEPLNLADCDVPSATNNINNNKRISHYWLCWCF